jgi:hypothetical protein
MKADCELETPPLHQSAVGQYVMLGSNKRSGDDGDD